jgi:hypothetical protein
MGEISGSNRRYEFFLGIDPNSVPDDRMSYEDLRRAPRCVSPIKPEEGTIVETFRFNREIGDITFSPVNNSKELGSTVDAR